MEMDNHLSYVLILWTACIKYIIDFEARTWAMVESGGTQPSSESESVSCKSEQQSHLYAPQSLSNEPVIHTFKAFALYYTFKLTV